MRTHYQVLGVEAQASADEIKVAYRRLARQHHPDTSTARSAGPERLAMAEINGAWEVLGDAKTRKAYDLMLGLRPPAGLGDTPAGRAWKAHDPDDDEYSTEGGSGHFGVDDPDASAPRRPSDLLALVPVALLIGALGLFFLSLVASSPNLRLAGEIMVVVAGVSFITAPLFAMIRARSRP